MTKKIIDCATGEIIERDLNEEELAQQAKDEKEVAKLKKAESEAIATRKILLDKLGITEDEARLLLGGN